jgi:hypothetical protein
MSQPDPISADEIDRLVEALRHVGISSNLASLLKAVGANTISEMTPSQFVHAMSWIQQRRRLKQEPAEA